MLGRAGLGGPDRGEIRLDERDVAGLEQVCRPRNRGGPQTVDVLCLGPDGVARLCEQGVGVGEVALGEQIGEDADHVVAELALVAVHPRVEGVAAPSDLGVDEPAPIGVVESRIRYLDAGDAGQLLVPEGAHVIEMGAEAPGAGQSLRARPGIVVPEPVGGDDIVVGDGRVRSDPDRRGVDGHQAGGRLGIRIDRPVGGVGHAYAGVHRDEGTAADDHPVGELGDGHDGAGPLERGDLGREVPVCVDPGRRGSCVDPEPVVLVDAVLDNERPAEAGDDALVIAFPPDRRRGGIGAGERIGVQVERAVIGGQRPGFPRRRDARLPPGRRRPETNGGRPSRVGSGVRRSGRSGQRPDAHDQNERRHRSFSPNHVGILALRRDQRPLLAVAPCHA